MDRIALNNIRKEYSAFTLDGVSFPVKEGFITGFIGPNGSGKTTTIRAILNLNHLQGGEVLYRGVRRKTTTTSRMWASFSTNLIFPTTGRSKM